ncbi:hypothetical protein JOC59_000583 [Weissella beninensis]|uniref:Peptidase C39-like domain-containing protein n=1 Tax=Periweissella beninensis TaxID=504936 RepID=A0ABT0VG12_9LACO|nr:hypothetical protein [Periweissella beninensis]MBM7543879.1 hypothetical protein [Periweissella beninensis]MCM2436740.1 hypothetical protein [Periweissella beninensis]
MNSAFYKITTTLSLSTTLLGIGLPAIYADSNNIHKSSTTTVNSTTQPVNYFSGQYLQGSRTKNVKIGTKWYRFTIPTSSQIDNMGHTFVNSGCTENSIANAMALAGIIDYRSGENVSKFAAALWQAQTGKNPNQRTSNNGQSVGYVGYTRPVSKTKANQVIQQANKKYQVLTKKESFKAIGSAYFGYGKGNSHGNLVARYINKWAKSGYFIVLLNRSNGHSDSANHATTILNLAANFTYGKQLNLLDSYESSNSYFLTQRLSNKHKLSWTYKAVAYKATDKNGQQIMSNYYNTK